MCIKLIHISLTQNDLTPSEKHILLILCARANPETHQFFTSIPRLINDSGYSLNTVEKIMKKLRNTKKIIKTGEKIGKRKLIPIYKINILIPPVVGGDKSLITPIETLIPPMSGVVNTPNDWGTERILERKLEREDFLKNLSQEEYSIVRSYLDYKIPLPDSLEYLKPQIDNLLN